MVEWPFYVKFSLLGTGFDSIIGWLREYFLFIYCRVCLHRHDQQRCVKRSSGPWSVEYFESAEKLGIFRRRYIVGILTTEYYLVPYRLSTDSKTRDLEWPRMAILR